MTESTPTTEAVVERTREIVGIRSVIGDEKELAEHCQALLQSWSPHRLVRAENSLFVSMRARDPARSTVMLVGHLDTVPGHDDNPVRIEGDSLYGLGTSDMKASDALILEVLRWNRAVPLRYNVIGVLYSREEGPYLESEMPAIREAAGDAFDADLAVCMEPTDGRIELGCLGTSHARVRFGGRRAHSARPWQGDNAIHKAAGFLQRLAARPMTTHEFGGLQFVDVMSATMVEYRGARNVVPDRFEINVNYRFAPPNDEAGVRQAIDELVAGEAEWELVDFCPAGRICADNPLVQSLREAAGQDGQPAEVTAKQAWTDVGRLSLWGIDAINWGPGATAQAHQAGEWVSIEAIDHACQAIVGWLQD